jgi:23S rRNA (uracil1939-C5)-methyltransferase
VEEKRGHARAELVEILSPSPERIVPRCPHHFSIRNLNSEIRNVFCGGCHYQHLSYPAQLATKTAILCEQLERLGGLSNPPVRPIIPSPTPWNYRNHVQFHLTPEGKLGFEAAHSNQVIPLHECHLPEKPLTELWPQLDIEPIVNLERVSLRLGAGDEMMIVFECAEPLDFTIEDLTVSAVQVGPGGTLVLAGSDHLVIEVGNRPFRVSPESFFQVNTPLAAAMVDHLLTHLPLHASTTLLDLYCGVGLFSAFLAPKVKRLVGVEISPSACEDFTVNLDEFDHVELYEADAADVLPMLDFRPEIILVDPPRAGLGPQVLAAMIHLAAPTLAYVSCDPATLARDARRLVEGGYHLKHITPFDLFPQTYHIESISIWEK